MKMNSQALLDVAVRGAERLRADLQPEEHVAAEQHCDHALAVHRGERLARIADRAADSLFAAGQINNITEFRAALIPALCDELFPGLAVDLPRLR